MARTRTPSQLIRPRLPVIRIPRPRRRIRRYRLTQEKRRRPSLERLLTRLCHYSRTQRACRLTVSTALLPVLPEKKNISAALRSSGGCFTTLRCCRTQPRPFADCRRRRPFPASPSPAPFPSPYSPCFCPWCGRLARPSTVLTAASNVSISPRPERSEDFVLASRGVVAFVTAAACEAALMP